MRAGRLRHRAALQERLEVSNTGTAIVYDTSERADGWKTVASFACDIQALNGRELQAVFQRWAEAKFKIRMRYQSGVEFRRERSLLWIEPTMGERRLAILDAEDPDTRTREMIVYAKEYTE